MGFATTSTLVKVIRACSKPRIAHDVTRRAVVPSTCRVNLINQPSAESLLSQSNSLLYDHKVTNVRISSRAILTQPLRTSVWPELSRIFTAIGKDSKGRSDLHLHM